jgi:hypothetical protein
LIQLSGPELAARPGSEKFAFQFTKKRYKLTRIFGAIKILITGLTQISAPPPLMFAQEKTIQNKDKINDRHPIF